MIRARSGHIIYRCDLILEEGEAIPSVVHFEIGADDPERAVKFYADVFGWKVERWGEAPYWLVEPGEGGAGKEGAGEAGAGETGSGETGSGETGGGETGSGEAGPGIGGAIMRREGNNTTVNTISVPSLDEFMARVEAAGGKVASPRMTIPGIGYHAYCTDTEGNTFGILETDREAA